ncbi:GlsB/YeaQ/YmgE family stress response membrane protein [Pseudofrankia sp. DC12]|uniref:GlsB/YeaQ/YmgE family stress response membrane protein n=1 Tax=Pseudofrankia sp. DC12 TaxID=683315 RepID=UPI0005F86B8B|nr:GlsB/YeaQ/YmgE family stress response membrane protein [Pseudofrankia sp. DC12]
MLLVIISWIVLGLIAGAVARLLVPGPDPMSIPMTALLGIGGSFVGGFLGYVLFHKDLGEGALQPSGILGSIIGAIVLLLVYRAVGGRRRVRR